MKSNFALIKTHVRTGFFKNAFSFYSNITLLTLLVLLQSMLFSRIFSYISSLLNKSCRICYALHWQPFLLQLSNIRINRFSYSFIYQWTSNNPFKNRNFWKGTTKYNIVLNMIILPIILSIAFPSLIFPINIYIYFNKKFIKFWI